MAINKTRDSLLRILESRPSLGGRFIDIQRIDANGGGGNFSMLVTATDEKTGERVAVKVFDPLKRGDAYRLACFDREADVLGSLVGKPDILQLIAPKDSFQETLTTSAGIAVDVEFSYFVTELAVSNGLLGIQGGNLDAEAAFVQFRAMCRATQRLHQSELVHRDLKPENFLVMASGATKLADFGAARGLGSGDSSLLPVYSFWPGDLRYAAPEVLAGLHDEQPSVSFGADMFSLGAVLFEMFSGTLFALEVFDSSFAVDLTVHMSHVPVVDRRRVLDGILPSLKDSHSIPTTDGYHNTVPPSIRPHVDRLVRMMTDLDYRTRTRDFASVFRWIEICLVVLRNEGAYQRWRTARRARRLASLGSR